MTEVEETTLIDLALGLRDDPELREAVRRSHDLRKRFRKVEKDLRRLDGELDHLGPRAANGPRLLRRGPWRILLAVDDSEPSERAVDAAAAVAATCGGEILVFHVREIAPCSPCLETSAEAAALVADVVGRLRMDGLRAEGQSCTSRSGNAARDIVRVADCSGADLIILGSRGLSDLAASFIGSVAHQAIRRASCPVLVIR